jgi:hypothetical protein
MKFTLWTGLVVVVLAPSVASASYIKPTLTSVSPGVNLTIYESSTYSSGVGTTAGSFNWTHSGNNYLPSALKTFCIEIGQHVGIGNTYTYKLDSQLQNYPTSGSGAGTGAGTSGAMGLVKADLLRELYGRYYNTLGSSNVNNAAFQLAIWEITHDGYSTVNAGQYYSGNVIGTGDFRMTTTTGAAGSAMTLANSWLASLNGQGPKSNNLIVLTSPTAQDQIAVAPAPPAIGLAIAGIITLFGLKRRARRAALHSKESVATASSAI